MFYENPISLIIVILVFTYVLDNIDNNPSSTASPDSFHVTLMLLPDKIIPPTTVDSNLYPFG